MTLTGLDVDTLRAGTPGCGEYNHLNNAGAALLSNETLAAVIGHLQLESRIGGYEAADEASPEIEDTYGSLAELVGSRREEIALFDNSTHAWNAAFYSIPLRRGDRVLTGRDEYGSNVLAYLQLAERTGVEVVVVPDDDTGQIDTGALADLLDERVRAIGLTWVPTAGGLVNPAAEVGRLARAADVLYLLDATQVVGQLPIDVDSLGCDLLTGTGRKFLRGPRGTGFLYAGQRAIERLEPYVAEIGSATWDGRRSFTWDTGAARFATWEHSYANVLGLGSAVRQALDVGIEAIADRCVALGTRLRDALSDISGVTAHDLGTSQCAIVTIDVAGHSAQDVMAALRAQHINVSTTVPEHNQFDTESRHVHPLVRLSPHYYNTEIEIDRAVAEVATIAARRP